jgi:hypothetical protein
VFAVIGGWHLVVQAGLGVGIGLLFALIAFATDLNGLGSLLATSRIAPFVVATAIGLLGFEKR